MATHQPPPLTGIRVLEFAGLAPGPFAGLLLADYGASVLRLDRTSSSAPATDQLTRRKTSIRVDIKSGPGRSLIKNLIPHVDVIIDPFRPGVLEKAGLCPSTVLLALNPRLIVARITGFRREGKYADMAGHDINYLAVNGVLSMLGRKGEKPFPPGNILADFAGGGAMAFMGILLALLARHMSGRGQVVEANMVDGSAMLATFLRLAQKTPRWNGERGTNTLDGGAPFYDTYETKDGKYMAVGAIEPQFYAELIRGLNVKGKDVPDQWDTEQWPVLRDLFTATFKSKTRAEWEAIFDGTDACCTPVLTHGELEKQRYDQRPAVTLKSSPGLAVHEGEEGRAAAVGQGKGTEGSGWDAKIMAPGHGGKETLNEWLGWKEGRHFVEEKGGLVWKDEAKL